MTVILFDFACLIHRFALASDLPPCMTIPARVRSDKSMHSKFHHFFHLQSLHSLISSLHLGRFRFSSIGLIERIASCAQLGAGWFLVPQFWDWGFSAPKR